jgi:hypothetical protein
METALRNAPAAKPPRLRGGPRRRLWLSIALFFFVAGVVAWLALFSDLRGKQAAPEPPAATQPARK